VVTSPRWTTLTLVLGLYAASIVLGAVVAPDRMPLHWGFDGQPDRYGSRGDWVLQTLIIGALLVLVVVVGLLSVMRGSTHRMHVPNREYWTRPEHVDELRNKAADLVVDMVGDAILLVAIIEAFAVLRARNGDVGGTWMLFLVALFLLSELRRLVRMRTDFAIPPGHR
jgi:uncharacterized membrane protein